MNMFADLQFGTTPKIVALFSCSGSFTSSRGKVL